MEQTATPVKATPSAVSVVVDLPGGEQRTEGRWVHRSGTKCSRVCCDCCDCCGDCCICMSVCFCSCCTAGQIWQRTMRPPQLQSKPCGGHGFVVVALSILLLVVTIIALFRVSYDDVLASPTLGVASLFMWIGVIVAYVCVICNARAAVRRRDNIPQDVCGNMGGDVFGDCCCYEPGLNPHCCDDDSSCEDCCAAFFCNLCIQCQMLRHETTAGNFEYDLCSATGGPLSFPAQESAPHLTAVA